METYHIGILKQDKTLLFDKQVDLGGSQDLWPEIVAIARGCKDRNCRIRVTNEAGEVVVLAGVSAALGTPRYVPEVC